MVAWTPSDLKLISDDYLSTSQYQNRALGDAKLLLDKYEILGRELGNLSRILERSGRPPNHYWDPDLAKHIHEAKKDLEKHFNHDQTAPAFLERLTVKRLGSSKIAKLHQQAVNHIKGARDFKIDFLLDTRLEPLLAEDVEEDSNPVSHFTFDHYTTPQTQQLAQVATENRHVTEVEEPDTGSLVDDASGALYLARTVWKNMADISTKSRDRHRRSSIQPSAKQQFVVDVAELIENAELYTAGINMLDQNSRRALEQIVFKTIQLKHASVSPIVPALTRNTISRQASPEETSSAQRHVTDDHTNPRDTSLTNERLPYRPLQLPPSIISDSGLGWNIDGVRSEVDRTAIAADLNQSIPIQPTSILPDLHLNDDLEEENRAISHSIAQARDRLDGIGIVESPNEHSLRGWMKICSSQLGLQPTTCTLSIDEVKGEVNIEVVVLPRPMSISSFGGSDTSANRSSNPISLESILSQGSRSPYIHKFKHFLKTDNRSIPTVKHPKYEGSEKSPREPFTIAFNEAQLISEQEPQDDIRMVKDLKYIFSHKEDRDEIRAMLFGKTLMASTGVAKVEFDYIACTRQAISMWDDGQSGRKTITFFRQHTDRKHKIPGEVEYEIIGIEESRRDIDEDQPVVLYVELLSPQSTRQRCSLFFSDTSGKDVFVKLLRPP